MKQPLRKFKNTHFNKFSNWDATVMIDGRKYRSSGYLTEREAAIKVDLMFLEHGKEPINILKRKL